MSNADDIRWKQRFVHFDAAMRRLDAACGQDNYNDLEMAGLIQTFEFSFELAWKTLKDLLFVEGFDVKSPREALKQAHAAGLLDDISVALEAMESRNRMSHVYDEADARAALSLIKTVYAPMLGRIQTALRLRLGAES